VIINMADRMKDAEDLKLESLFASEEIADNGFSARIQKRLRRQLWVRRLALPTAVLVGGAIAVKPLVGLITAVPDLLSVVPASVSSNLQQVSSGSLPQLSTIMLGGMLVIVALTVARMLED
jgi:hypothetical protein